MSQHRMTPSEAKFLKDAFSSDFVNVNIRLREGEYQYNLAKVIAAFQLELYFPDVKDVIRRLYGEEKVGDIQFIRRIQTILKKMEKSNMVRILPKNRPWELQRYTLSSLKFGDSDKNLVVLATDNEVKQAQDLLQSAVKDIGPVAGITPRNVRITSYLLAFVVIVSFAVIFWDLMQPFLNPMIFASAFLIGVLSSIVLGKTLSKG